MSLFDGKDDEGNLNKDRPRGPTDEFLAGLGAAVVNVSVFFPVNKLIFRQMESGQNTMTALKFMYNDGFRYVYRGIGPPLGQKMLSNSIMFGCFSRCREYANDHFSDNSPFANLSIASVTAGTTEAVMATPLERVQVLLQDRKYHRNYKNTIDAFKQLYKSSLCEYYRGFTCIIIRNGPSNILFFGLRGWITEQIPGYVDSKTYNRKNSNHSNKQQSEPLRLGRGTLILSDFFTGAILGGFISTLFYPLSVVRIKMQTQAPGTEFLSIVKAFKQVYRKRDKRFINFYRGCTINIIRQCCAWGLTNGFYELSLDGISAIHYKFTK